MRRHTLRRILYGQNGRPSEKPYCGFQTAFYAACAAVPPSILSGTAGGNITV
ncbi:hypothetical protein [Kingella potus]|uniref:hypothetical protein n=1 Tax=Kingella potus TaxID=265175 RepID=UPI001FD4AF21|nr:hypothetical protein [Kingella potus]UOP01581.1 hypothetical protein LVJ84_05215 [Kingella potus]